MKKIKLTKDIVKKFLPNRSSNSYKYTYGKLLIWSGSLTFWGAPQLVCKGAYRAGVGLVRLACPEHIIPTIATTVPETTFIPLSVAPNGAFLPNTVITLLQEIQHSKITTCALGPGLGQSNFLRRLLTELIQKSPIPLIIDADALTALSQVQNYKELLVKEPVKILTPHEGEFSRLIDIDPEVIAKRRNELALEFAAENQIILVLKGPKTIITDGKDIYENSTGSVNLATAGTGDVLTGMIGSLVAQGLNPLKAAILGVYLHGKAGDIWLKKNTDRGMLASDLCDYITLAYQTIN